MWPTMPRDRGPSAAMACVYLHFATALYNLWQEYMFQEGVITIQGKEKGSQKKENIYIFSIRRWTLHPPLMIFKKGLKQCFQQKTRYGELMILNMASPYSATEVTTFRNFVTSRANYCGHIQNHDLVRSCFMFYTSNVGKI